MECKEYSELISAYVDDNLSLVEEEQLLAHLKVCEACQQEVNIMKQMKEMLGKLEGTKLPSNFHSHLMNRIHKEKQMKMPSLLKWKWQYRGALVATAIIGFLCLGELGGLDIGKNGIGEETATVEAAPDVINYGNQENIEQSLSRTKPSQNLDNDIGDMQMSTESKSKTMQLKSDLASWNVNKEDFNDLINNLLIYLEEKQIDFEVQEDRVICYQIKETEELREWMKVHADSFEGEIPSEISDVEIKIMGE